MQFNRLLWVHKIVLWMPKNKLFFRIHGLILWMRFNKFYGCIKSFYGCGKMVNEVISSNMLYLGIVLFL